MVRVGGADFGLGLGDDHIPMGPLHKLYGESLTDDVFHRVKAAGELVPMNK